MDPWSETGSSISADAALPRLRLRNLPFSARLMLTAFLAIVGSGYLFGVANIFMYHRSADGDPRLTLTDLKAVYTGLVITSQPAQPRPRMLEMIDTSMRKYLQTDEEYRTLREWIVAGAEAEAFKAVPASGERSPHDILADRCLRCHNPEGEQGQEEAHASPFGPDLFEIDLAMVQKYARPGPAVATTRKVGPQSTQRLILVSHVHMLSIPVFTLLTSLLLLMTGLPRLVRGPLVCLPMLALVADFAGWWLARTAPWAIWFIALSGPVYSVTLAGQIFGAFGSLWFGKRR